jgi:hypothetical protein
MMRVASLSRLRRLHQAELLLRQPLLQKRAFLEVFATIQYWVIAGRLYAEFRGPALSACPMQRHGTCSSCVSSIRQSLIVAGRECGGKHEGARRVGADF